MLKSRALTFGWYHTSRPFCCSAFCSSISNQRRIRASLFI
ncbi:Uncharacterised protein [Vibrio cholerae]|nr:Uncharacterised protein [Vibrio cholerae]